MTAEHTLAFLSLLAVAPACGSDYRIGACAANVVINEVMASSHDAEFEGYGEDWIELFNASDQGVELEGWRLSTTSTVLQHQFGPGLLAPGGYRVVFASTYALEDSEYESTGFDLNRDAGALFLRAPATEGNHLCDELHYPDQHADFSWQRVVEGQRVRWCHAFEATFGEINDSRCMCDDQAGAPWC